MQRPWLSSCRYSFQSSTLCEREKDGSALHQPQSGVDVQLLQLSDEQSAPCTTITAVSRQQQQAAAAAEHKTTRASALTAAV